MAGENTGNRTGLTRLKQDRCGGRSRPGRSTGTQEGNKVQTDCKHPENTIKADRNVRTKTALEELMVTFTCLWRHASCFHMLSVSAKLI